jgi:hypothetical protein
MCRSALEDRAAVRSKEHRRRLLASIEREQIGAREDTHSLAVEGSSVAIWDSDDEPESHVGSQGHVRAWASRSAARSLAVQGVRSMPRATESPFAVLELRRCQEQLVAATQYIEELESEIAWNNANASALSAAETPPHAHKERGGEGRELVLGARECGIHVDDGESPSPASHYRAAAMPTLVSHTNGGDANARQAHAVEYAAGPWPRTSPRKDVRVPPPHASEVPAAVRWQEGGTLDTTGIRRQAQMAGAHPQVAEEEREGPVSAQEQRRMQREARREARREKEEGERWREDQQRGREKEEGGGWREEQQHTQRLHEANSALQEANRTIIFCTTSTLHCLRRLHHRINGLAASAAPYCDLSDHEAGAEMAEVDRYQRGRERRMSRMLPPCVSPVVYASDSSLSQASGEEPNEEEEEEEEEMYAPRAFGDKWRVWSVPRQLDSSSDSSSSSDEVDAPSSRGAALTLSRGKRAEAVTLSRAKKAVARAAPSLRPSAFLETRGNSRGEAGDGERQDGMDETRAERGRYLNQYCLEPLSNPHRKPLGRRGQKSSKVLLREEGGDREKVVQRWHRKSVGDGALERAGGVREGRETSEERRREHAREAGRGGGWGGRGVEGRLMGSGHELEVLLRLASKRLSFS